VEADLLRNAVSSLVDLIRPAAVRTHLAPSLSSPEEPRFALAKAYLLHSFNEFELWLALAILVEPTSLAQLQ